MKPIGCVADDDLSVTLSVKRRRESECEADMSNMAAKRRPFSAAVVGGLAGVAAPLKIASKLPSLKVTVQPEKYIRARYISEGCRGAMRGTSENSFPTVKIDGYSGPAVVDVYLATAAGDPHDNILVCCSNLASSSEEVTLPGSIRAIRVRAGPETDMKAVFDNMSIRRLRKFEVEETLRKRNINPEIHQSDRSRACLKFVASLPKPDGSNTLLNALSAPLQCMAEPGAPEVLLVTPSSGSPSGDFLLTLVGKKFKSGFKVRFSADYDGELWQVWADVNREMSNQGAAVVTVPRFANPAVRQPVTVNIEVKVGPEREPLYSEPAEFTYTPTDMMTCTLCERCRSVTLSTRSQATPSPVALSPAETFIVTSPSPAGSRAVSPSAPSPAMSSYSQSSIYTNDSVTCPSPIDSLLDDSMFDSAFASGTSSPVDTSCFSEVNLDDLIASNLSAPAERIGLARPAFDFSTFQWKDSDVFDMLPLDSSSSSSADLDEEQAWRSIQSVVGELSVRATPPTSKILRFLEVLVQGKDPSLLKIYQRCHTTALGIPGVQPSSLMKDELNTYLQAALSAS